MIDLRQEIIKKIEDFDFIKVESYVHHNEEYVTVIVEIDGSHYSTIYCQTENYGIRWEDSCLDYVEVQKTPKLTEEWTPVAIKKGTNRIDRKKQVLQKYISSYGMETLLYYLKEIAKEAEDRGKSNPYLVDLYCNLERTLYEYQDRNKSLTK